MSDSLAVLVGGSVVLLFASTWVGLYRRPQYQYKAIRNFDKRAQGIDAKLYGYWVQNEFLALKQQAMVEVQGYSKSVENLVQEIDGDLERVAQLTEELGVVGDFTSGVGAR